MRICVIESVPMEVESHLLSKCQNSVLERTREGEDVSFLRPQLSAG